MKIKLGTWNFNKLTKSKNLKLMMTFNIRWMFKEPTGEQIVTPMFKSEWKKILFNEFSDIFDLW